jgi:RNA-directed DNA polymerase
MSSLRYFKKHYQEHGLPENLANKYSAYASNLRDQGLPVIFEIEHLALQLNVEVSFLYSVFNSPTSFYRNFELQKKSGGVRNITAPYPSLLRCQTWIKENILDTKKNYPDYVTAYVSGKSVIDNANSHAGSKVVLNVDLKDFFPSIPKNWVIKIFRDFGYASNVAFYLACLCCYEEALPQGAPTSPVISNMVCRILDRRLYRLARKASLRYTRYADDITFSGAYIARKFLEIVERIIQEQNFTLNSSKTRLLTSHNRKVVTGINVSSVNLSLTRKYKRELTKEAYFIEKYGLRSHILKRKIRDTQYVARLEGKARYWANVESWNDDAARVLAVFVNAGAASTKNYF